MNPILKWKYTAGNKIYSSPKINNNTVYFGSWDTYIYALNLDGTLKWKYATGGPILSSPAFATDGTIYVNGTDNYVYALNPNGTLKWKYSGVGAVRSSPAVSPIDGTIYVNDDNGHLRAISATGIQVWSYALGGSSSSEATPVVDSTGVIYISSYYYGFFAINPNGTLKWNNTAVIPASGYVIGTAAIGNNGTIYVSVAAPVYKIYALNADGTQKWNYSVTSTGLLSINVDSNNNIYALGYLGTDEMVLYMFSSGGALTWSYTTASGNTTDPYFVGASIPAIDGNGVVYFGALDNNIYAINSNGTLNWTYATSGEICSSAFLDSSNTLYIGSLDSNLYALTLPVVFEIIQASAIQNNIIDVDFNKVPMAINPNGLNDVLNPSNWLLVDANNKKISIASISVPVFSNLIKDNGGIPQGANSTNVKNGLSVFITTAGALLSNMTYTLTAFSNIYSSLSIPISGTLVWTFYGIYATEAMTFLKNLIGNDLSYDFISNDITATSDGDWDVMTGIPQIKKKILRRLTTPLGGFFHLPNFGVAIPSKTLLTPSKVLKLQKDLQRQILQEIGVTGAAVTVSQNANGILSANATVQTKTTTFETGVIQLGG